MFILKLLSLFFVFVHVTNVPLDCDFWCKKGMNISGTGCECSALIEPKNTYKADIDQDSAIYYEPIDDTALPTIEKSFFIPNPVHKIYKKDNFRSSLVNYPAVHRVLKSISDGDDELLTESNIEYNDLYLDIDLVKDLGRANDIKQQYDILKMQINLMDCLSLQSYFDGEEHEIPSNVNIPTTINIISKEGKELLKSKCKYVENIFASAAQEVYDSYPKKYKYISGIADPNKLEVPQTTTEDSDVPDVIDSRNFERTDTHSNDDEEVADLFTAPSTQVKNTVELNQLYDSTTVTSPLLDDTTDISIKSEVGDYFEDNDVITLQLDDQEPESINEDIKTTKADLKYNISDYENYHTGQATSNTLNLSEIKEKSNKIEDLIIKTTTMRTEIFSIGKTPELNTDNYTLFAISTSAIPAPSLESETDKSFLGEAFTFRGENDLTSDTSMISNKDSTDATTTTNLSPLIVEIFLHKGDADKSLLNYKDSTDIVSAENSSILTIDNVADTLDRSESENTHPIVKVGNTDLSESFEQTGQEINVIEMQKSNQKNNWMSNNKDEITNNQTINDTETTSIEDKGNSIEDNAFGINKTISEMVPLNNNAAGHDEIKGFIYLIHNDKQIPVRFIQGPNGEIRIAINGLSFCQQLGI